MHSRKKTPKDETKEKEKELKAKKFHSAMTKFLNLKKSGCKDVNLLKDISTLLRISPEFTTLWNYRKEILIAFKESNPNLVNKSSKPIANQIKAKSNNDSVKAPTKKVSKVNEFDEICSNELTFIENSLQTSPKTYATWHHRVWLIQFMNNPDIKKELQLCNQCLTADERNFHCWNYRRFIVKFGNIPLMDEFKFTSKKIMDNFSNFSSWHYRSCLYKQLATEEHRPDEIKSLIDKDFDMVTNAIFTDPNDQSPWLYFRWLLEFENSFNISEKFDSIVQRFLLAKKSNFNNDNKFLFAIEFTRPFAKLPDLNLKIDEQNVNLTNWKLISSESSKIWIASVSDLKLEMSQTNRHKISLIFENENIEKMFDPIMDSNRKVTCFAYRNNSLERFSENISKRIEPLKTLLEIETDSKWPNYMLTILDSYDISDFDNKIIKLISLDPIRFNYYNDMRSKMFLKNQFSTSKIIDLNYDLKGYNLHSLYYMNHLMHIQYLNLSSNKLVKIGKTFSPLVNLRCLILDCNQIKFCDENLHLENLAILSLQNNFIDNHKFIVNCLCQVSTKLKHLNLIGNPLKKPIENSIDLNQGVIIYLDSEDESKFQSLLQDELEQLKNYQTVWSEQD